MSLSSALLLVISVVVSLLAMAFFTLLERKILGYSQLRKGPNKVGVLGVPQPLADALKLLSKECPPPFLTNWIVFLFSPFLSLLLALMLWGMSPMYFFTVGLTSSVLLFLCVSSISVYTVLFAGWSANSKYSLLGSLRAMAQTISYEISMALVLLGVLVLGGFVSLKSLVSFQPSSMLVLGAAIFLVWGVTSLAETNRTPFDHAEGESELVSGFNTEYSSSPFTLIFMAEYLNILFLSLVSSCILVGSLGPSLMGVLPLLTGALGVMFIWVRTSYPRMRYDYLMSLTWKSFLLFSLGSLFLYLFLGN